MFESRRGGREREGGRVGEREGEEREKETRKKCDDSIGKSSDLPHAVGKHEGHIEFDGGHEREGVCVFFLCLSTKPSNEIRGQIHTYMYMYIHT